MARNRISGTVTVGIGLVALLVVGGGAWRFISGPGDDADDFPPAPTGTVANPESDVGLAAADRPGETVQALAADQENLRSRIDGISENFATGIGGLSDQLLQIGEELTLLKSEQAASAETGDMQTRIEQLRTEMLASIQDMREELQRTGSDYPVGGEAAPRPNQGIPGQDGYVWYTAGNPEPIGGAIPGTGLAALQERLNIRGSGSLALSRNEDVPPEPLPVYTIPSNATLVRSRSLTSLIGRVPLNGQVVDPFPFQVVTGKDNLLAGRQDLPELEHAIWSGTATGDATLRCVTGRLDRVTFIFRDGTISETTGGDTAGHLGWISNEQGYPCIPGKFVSNLQENIGKITSASFASSLARAWSEQQATTIQEGGAVTRSITGNPGEYALGQGISGGIDEWARIVAERAREAFDAVVVPAGQTINIHVSQSIPIDWPPEGRRVRHVSALSDPVAANRPGGLD